MAVLQFGWEERRRFGDAAAVHSATTRDGLRIDYSRFRLPACQMTPLARRSVTVAV
jgi:hypothetical protein